MTLFMHLCRWGLLLLLLVGSVGCSSDDGANETPEPTPDTPPQVEVPFTLRGAKVAILGDSYSTYGGWIPAGYLAWYAQDGTDGNNSSKNDVASVSDTWWHQLITEWECRLLINSSYSGSPICNTGYEGMDNEHISFIARMKIDLAATKCQPTLILILGGTNDHYAGAPCGVPLYAGWSAADLKQFCPAFCYMLDYLKGEHPNAKIVNVMNDCFSVEWVARIEAMTAHYGVQNIALSNIKGSANLQGGHPTKATMKRIKEQIVAALTK